MNTASPQTNAKSAPVPARHRARTRRCLVSGEDYPKAELIRFVLDPAGQVTPDLAGRLPGRGLWVHADTESLEKAALKNLFSRSAKKKATVPEDLLVQLDVLFKRRCLELLGLARSAGATVTGMPQIEQGLRSGKIAVVLLAKDAGKDTRKKLSHTDVVEVLYTREEMAKALGRENLAAVGMRTVPMTETLLTELTRWHGAGARQTVLTDDSRT